MSESLPTATTGLNIMLTVKGAIVPCVLSYCLNHCHLRRSGDLLWHHRPDGGFLDSLKHCNRRSCHCSLPIQFDKSPHMSMIELASINFLRKAYKITNRAICKTHGLGIHEALQKPIEIVVMLRVRRRNRTQRMRQRLRRKLLVHRRHPLRLLHPLHG